MATDTAKEKEVPRFQGLVISKDHPAKFYRKGYYYDWKTLTRTQAEILAADPGFRYITAKS